MLHDEWPVCPRRGRCVAVISNDSPLVDGEADALNSNTGCTMSLGMDFREEMESSRRAGLRGSVISAFSSNVRVRVGAFREECP